MRYLLILCVGMVVFGQVAAQDMVQPDSLTTAKRKHLVAAIFAGTYGGSFISLNKTWYANYPRSGFHFYNDGKEWLQMDK
ncbi:MAG: hypothetical protein RL372_1861, partial [Bacteroidota bacterium]